MSPGGGYEAWLARFAAWAEAQPEIRAAIVLGSRARLERPADQWSDLDLWLLVTDAQPFLAATAWLEALGRPIVSFVEATATGDQRERRVLFEGGLDVDFIPVPVPVVATMLQQGGLPDGVRQILAAGYRVVVDKDNFAQQLPAEATLARPAVALPTQVAFTEFVGDFLYHVIWAAKKLGRGELWSAHGCLDGPLKGMLLRMIEWHARARKGAAYNTWHRGRFVEQWADPRAVAALPEIFARYDRDEMDRALVATHEIFRLLAVETAAAAGLVYPVDADAEVRSLLHSILEGRWTPGTTSNE
jgi:aminoglycoside 6-adenylyltransferase